MLAKPLYFIAAFFVSASVFAAPAPNALPTGGSVVHGSASFSEGPSGLQINQSSQQAIIQWQSFNVGADAKVHFQQAPNATALNRISPHQGASQVYGQLTATGKIILINQAGIYFGPSARVDVGGIIASTSDISDKNFLAGKYQFDQPSSHNGSIVNQGTIIARNNGLVALVGGAVSNEGVIQARAGNVVLASGNKFTVSLSGDQLVNFSVDEASDKQAVGPDGKPLRNAVNNSGKILADGGTILMTAKTARQIMDHAINMSGVAQARSVAEKNGVIIFSSNENIAVSGKIDVSGETGGTVKVLGKQVQIASSANIDASGQYGGGEILIGGNLKGQGPEANAWETEIEKGAIITADAQIKGNGGKVIVWSDNNTGFHGSISAQGGSLGGNGGFVETSGGHLDVTDGQVNTLAAHGTTGNWLLDPTDIYIANSASSPGVPAGINTSANTSTGTDPATFAATGATDASLLTVSALENALATSNVIVTTTNTSGTGNGDIFVLDPVTWGTNTSLTLSAARNINVNAAITNTASGNLILQTDTSGSGTAQLAFNGPGAVNLTGGQATVYYNPAVFGTQDVFPITAGGGTTQYMLINSLGSEADTTTRSLASLSNNAAFWSENFALSTDIDASPTSSWNGGDGFFPIAFGSEYMGSFDGQGHTIDSLESHYPNTSISGDYGFFSRLGAGGVVKNIGLTNLNVTGDFSVNPFQNSGGLVGFINAGGTVQNAYATGTVSITGTGLRTGGLIGVNLGAMDNTYSTVDVTINSLGNYMTAGSLVGSSFSATLSNSYATGSVTVSGNTDVNFTGGLAGENQDTSLTNSYSSGTVSSNTTSNFNIYIGGLVGYNVGAAASITDSYSTSALVNISGTTPLPFSVGGLVGSNATAAIDNSYSTGIVPNVVGASVGGLVGDSTGPVTNSYWNTQTSGQSTSGGGTGYTTAQLQSGLPSGFSSGTWGILPGQSYPYLKALYTTTPRAISGYVPGGSAGATGITSSSVQLGSNGNNVADNGLVKGTALSGDNGYYYFLEPDGTITDGSALIVYISATPSNSVTVAPSNGGSIAGLNLTANTVTLGDANTNTITNTTLINAISGSVGPGILYTATPSSVTLDPGINFTTTSTTTYDINNDINTSGGGQIIINGPLNINSTVGGAITVADGQTVTVGTSGNVSQINGGLSNVYNISGTVGTITGGGGTNFFTIGTGGSITNLLASGSGTNTLALSTNGDNTWTVNGQSGGISGAINIGSYTNISTIQGGNGNDIFQVASASPLSLINGGGGNNTLSDNISGNNSIFNVTDGNSGTFTSIGAFNNIQNLTGNATGTNTFVFTGIGFVTGLINGGNTANTNVIDVTGMTAPVNLVLGPKTGTLLNTGILTTGTAQVASFTNVQFAKGNGGIVTFNPESLISSMTVGANGVYTVSDPFYFTGFTPVIVPPTVPVLDVANIVTGAPLSQSSDTVAVAAEQQSLIFYSVNQNVTEILAGQIIEDAELANTSYCTQ